MILPCAIRSSFLSKLRAFSSVSMPAAPNCWASAIFPLQLPGRRPENARNCRPGPHLQAARARYFGARDLITSHPTAELTRRAAGANGPIVEKPLLGNALMERIRDACAQKSSDTQSLG